LFIKQTGEIVLIRKWQRTNEDKNKLWKKGNR
jgi:hypothetical protein